jgi:hypothetical protein
MNEQEKEKLPKLTELKVGSITTQNLSFPGLSDKTSTCLYFRDSALDLLKPFEWA